MKISILFGRGFERSYKRLKKKYKSLPNDLKLLVNQLNDNPHLGDRVGENFYKIRLAIKSKGRGKSGGARVITHVEILVVEQEDLTEITLLEIYDKGELATVKQSDIVKMLAAHKKLEEE